MDNLAMQETIVENIIKQLNDLREEFKKLPFDFHSCFYYEDDKFKIHRAYLQ